MGDKELSELTVHICASALWHELAQMIALPVIGLFDPMGCMRPRLEVHERRSANNSCRKRVSAPNARMLTGGQHGVGMVN